MKIRRQAALLTCILSRAAIGISETEGDRPELMGQSYEAVVEKMGEPKSSMAMGDVRMIGYDGVKIELTGDTVSSVEWTSDKEIRSKNQALATSSYSQAYQNAMKYLIRGNQGKAEQTLIMAVARDKEDQRALFFLAVCTQSRGEKKEALKLFYKVIKLDAKSPEARCAYLMVTLGKQTEYKRPIASLEALYKQNPDDPLILWVNAIVCREVGNRKAPRLYSEKGVKYYKKLLETMNPGSSLLHQSCAEILSGKLGRHEEALQHRELALRLEPSPWRHQEMADTLTYLKRYAEADTLYKNAVQMDPDNPDFLGSWAWSMAQRGNDEEAFELYKQQLEIKPDDPKVWRDIGHCAKRLNRPKEAKEFYSKAKELDKK